MEPTVSPGDPARTSQRDDLIVRAPLVVQRLGVRQRKWG